jgi:Fe-S cluster assembly protein SufD
MPTNIQGNRIIEDQFIADFENNRDLILRNDMDTVRDARLNAFEVLKTLSIPTSRHELYKYTNLKSLFENSGRLLHRFETPLLTNPIEEFFRCNITELDTYDIVLIDGYYPHTLPLFQRLDGGAVMGSLLEATELYPEMFEQHYGKYVDISNDFLSAFNATFAKDGVFAHFPANTTITKPIQIVSLINRNENLLFNPIVQSRNLIVVEKNCTIKIVFCDHTMVNERSITNLLSEIYVGENSNVEIYKIQNQHNDAYQLSNLYIHQEANSTVSVNTISLHGGLIRNNLKVTLNGENASTNLYGLYLVDRKQQVDNYTLIDHVAPHCNSTELYKGILDDEAKGTFRGKIMVQKDAQKTNSYQKNDNLLLSDNATMNSMPQLEIYADDVKCSHGATVGYLDNEAMFYLQSRGINSKEARLLLMNAFASEVINKIGIPSLRDRLSYLVQQRLRGELSPCATCVLKCHE